MATDKTTYLPTKTRQAIDHYFNQAVARTRAETVSDIKGARAGVARTRYREGFTDDAGFAEELRLLHYTDEEVTLELLAGKLEYATDFTRDLISAYISAVRSGQISVDKLRELLLRLGIVPERVEGYALKEIARLKPSELVTAIAPSAPYYETDAGKVDVDTLRRLRRKLQFTRDEEIAKLQALGMPVAMALALADNDDARLAEKGTEES